jgi:hypothetical protein
MTGINLISITFENVVVMFGRYIGCFQKKTILKSLNPKKPSKGR